MMKPDKKLKLQYIYYLLVFLTVTVLHGLIVLMIRSLSRDISRSFLELTLFSTLFCSISTVLILILNDIMPVLKKGSRGLLLTLGFALGVFATGEIVSLAFRYWILFYESARILVFLLTSLVISLTLTSILAGVRFYQSLYEAALNEAQEENRLRELMEQRMQISRLHPHFLFNTLNLVISLLDDRERSEEALYRLSGLLRSNFDFSGIERIRLSEELRYTEDYLRLQKLRFEERLSYRIDCRADFEIPPLILQPLVENSIRHNLDQCDRLEIVIDGYSSFRGGRITVIDSRRKLEPAMIRPGHGLEITRRRVELSGGNLLIENGGVTLTWIK